MVERCLTSVPLTTTLDLAEIPDQQLRCLWLTRVDPKHPDAGDLSYSFHLLTSLRRAGVKVTVLAAARASNCALRSIIDGVEWRLFDPKKTQRSHRSSPFLRSLFSRLPDIASRHKTVEFRHELDAQLAKKWDAIVIDHLGMGWTWPRVKAYCRRNSGVVSLFIAHGCEGEIRRTMAQNYRGNFIRKLGLHFDARRAGVLERKLIRQSSLLSVITAEDRCNFGNLAKSVLLTPGYAGAHARSREITTTTPRRVLMFGSAVWLAKQMNLKEFIAAADELFWHNQIELWVVGKVPDQLRTERRHRATRFLGFVDDPGPIFRDVRIGIVAERTGGGFKLKSLDYIFNRVPIAAITGSIASLPLIPGRHYLSFDSMPQLAQGVADVIDDIERLNCLQRAAYGKCAAGFDWSDRGRILSDAIQEAVNQKRENARIRTRSRVH
jgi:glycosyltransferase involved in cell wall biosynthesis